VVEIRLEARCFPTEERDKVVRAILNIFPDAEVSGEEELVGRAASIDNIKELLRKQRIRDAARSVLRRGARDGVTSFRLNKQVAAIGKVSFSSGPQPLGEIAVTISSEDLDGVIDSLTSRDEGGRE